MVYGLLKSVPSVLRSDISILEEPSFMNIVFFCPCLSTFRRIRSLNQFPLKKKHIWFDEKPDNTICRALPLNGISMSKMPFVSSMLESCHQRVAIPPAGSGRGAHGHKRKEKMVGLPTPRAHQAQKSFSYHINYEMAKLLKSKI